MTGNTQKKRRENDNAVARCLERVQVVRGGAHDGTGSSRGTISSVAMALGAELLAHSTSGRSFVSEYVCPVCLNMALRISFTEEPGHRSFACGGRTLHALADGNFPQKNIFFSPRLTPSFLRGEANKGYKASFV